MITLYSETKITIKDLFIEKIKNAKTWDDKKKYMSIFDNWEEFLSELKPDGLLGNKIG